MNKPGGQELQLLENSYKGTEAQSFELPFGITFSQLSIRLRHSGLSAIKLVLPVFIILKFRYLL